MAITRSGRSLTRLATGAVREAGTWRLPMLGDLPRDEWPDTLRLVPPDPAIEGDVERMLCDGCQQPRTGDEVFDLTALPPGIRKTLPALVCAHCLQHETAKGSITWGALARGFSAPQTILGAYDHADVEGVRQGFNRRTPP